MTVKKIVIPAQAGIFEMLESIVGKNELKAMFEPYETSDQRENQQVRNDNLAFNANHE